MNLMDLIYVIIVGWCGTGLRIYIRFPRPGPGPPPVDPDNPWPIRGVIGAIAGLIIVYTMGSHFAGAGMLGITALAFFGGSFAADVITGVVDLVRGQPAGRG